MSNNGKLPLNRKAIANWLVENTSLSFKQIADFCGMHEMEIQGIADGDLAEIVIGQSPILLGQLTQEEIEKCEKDPKKSLTLKGQITDDIVILKKKKDTKYTPISKRKDKPNAIAFLLKYYPNINYKQIKRLLGITENLFNSIKNKTHWNIKNIAPESPVLLGLCSKVLFEEIISQVK
ncbi:MAG: DUF1013 domain-containing protein [Rickettsiales bacterium]|jgi:hypothetical protein|nr:DUF1013 domain-containing protein [Rickettsiales bacterium]